MSRKLLSAAILVMATSLAAPLVLADHGDRDRNSYREVREQRVETTYYRHDNGFHHGWRKHKHRHHDYHERRHYHGDDDYYPARRSSSSAPVILGSVIGGVVGHHVGHGDPGHTAVGAIIGTVIGYDIARHRNR